MFKQITNKMLNYDRLDVSEVIDVNKSSTSKGSKGFKFQSSVQKGCRDALMVSVNINSIPVGINHGVDYRCITLLLELRKVKPQIF